VSDLASSIRSTVEDLRFELDYRILTDEEREELLLSERLLAQCLQIDDDQKRDTKKEAA
jgi:hypothetical protein